MVLVLRCLQEWPTRSFPGDARLFGKQIFVKALAMSPWKNLNRLRTGVIRCKSNLLTWGLRVDDKREHGAIGFWSPIKLPKYVYNLFHRWYSYSKWQGILCCWLLEREYLIDAFGYRRRRIKLWKKLYNLY